jgi:hypothetical protein
VGFLSFVTGKRRTLLHSLYSSRNIIRMIKLGRMKGAGRVASMEQAQCIEGFGGKA